MTMVDRILSVLLAGDLIKIKMREHFLPNKKKRDNRRKWEIHLKLKMKRLTVDKNKS